MTASKTNPATPTPNWQHPDERPGPNARTKAMLLERDRLCVEAREHPESDAFDMVRAYVMTGMLASRQASDVEPATAEPSGAGRDAQIREKLSRIEQVARAAREAANNQMSDMEIFNKIRHVMGFDQPLVPIGPQAQVVGSEAGEDGEADDESEAESTNGGNGSEVSRS